MKNVIAIIIAVLPVCLQAQSAERQVIGSTGGYYSGSSVKVSATVGEAVTTTGTSATVILTQGFQQADGGAVDIRDLASGLSVSAYPNPSSDWVMLRINAPHTMVLTIQVFDVSGKLTAVPSRQIEVNGAATHPIDFSNLAAGNYYVRLTAQDDALHQTIRVQKVE